MCVLSIKVPIRKKSGNLFNNPRIFCNKNRPSRTIEALKPKLIPDALTEDRDGYLHIERTELPNSNQLLLTLHRNSLSGSTYQCKCNR